MQLCWEEAASRVGVICLTLEAAVPREELARGPGGGETSKEPRGQNLTASEGWPSTSTNLNDTVFDACGPHPGPAWVSLEPPPGFAPSLAIGPI